MKRLLYPDYSPKSKLLNHKNLMNYFSLPFLECLSNLQLHRRLLRTAFVSWRSSRLGGLAFWVHRDQSRANQEVQGNRSPDTALLFFHRRQHRSEQPLGGLWPGDTPDPAVVRLAPLHADDRCNAYTGSLLHSTRWSSL